ncbi:amino acid permease [Colletotrichum higginsianum]|uniref:Amino acid permease n=2 Tax=Colletotrichum higginsianum TaxID=80884 RepID=H1V9E4_COLHI|nr:Amino acid permease [Colletotrichum higginsianum IMI 349063]OBR06548.1 Amino acid permease [Colletotrichum higginsianum IMI 349063]TIC97352.1 General amino acid permease AGP2 [Colletotrichum higginsianum]GJD04425.1 amino acid permease [Colletotrichum higginsianum]CCF36847.1 amino acid permease [Colletotrichum higginsianum]
MSGPELKGPAEAVPGERVSLDSYGSSVRHNSDGLQRRLDNRQIQLIAIGGTIGTGLFVTIGEGLVKGGPGSLLLAYTLYACVVALVNNSIAEMSTYMPVSGGFIRLAGVWVDDALGFMVGWNYFLYEALLIPFEITALNLVCSFWNEKITEPGPTAGFCIAIILAYGLLNVVAVGIFGEAEFWLSGGKVLLIFILFFFTFITMVGGNPQHDAYGFRYWKNPGAFSQYLTQGDTGRMEGFMGALATATFTIVGPDYISMIAAEAKHPSLYIKSAFKTVYLRFGIFFVGAALTCGIVLPHNDPILEKIYLGGGEGGGTAAASPWVMAMENMKIQGLPHLVNALLFTTIFSAGNTYTYCATRSLYSLALDGRAPALLRKTTKNGVPIYCFAVTMIFPMLSFLQCGSGSATVLSWLLALITGGGVINYIVMSITFINYHRACKAQGIDRRTMPYYGYFQPYGAYIALVLQTIVILTYGWSAFRPEFDVGSFFSNYTMQIVAPLLFIFWKVLKRTHYIKPEDVDLTWDRPIIEAYEQHAVVQDPPVTFWREMLQMIGIGRNKVIKGEKA